MGDPNKNKSPRLVHYWVYRYTPRNWMISQPQRAWKPPKVLCTLSYFSWYTMYSKSSASQDPNRLRSSGKKNGARLPFLSGNKTWDCPEDTLWLVIEKLSEYPEKKNSLQSYFPKVPCLKYSPWTKPYVLTLHTLRIRAARSTSTTDVVSFPLTNRCVDNRCDHFLGVFASRV
jgi:hypothetical protein